MLPDTLSSISIDEKLEISTLGHFSVKKGNNTISDECNKSQRLWNLFNYILTFRNKRIVLEDFFDILWSEKECENPVKALQNLVYRLRTLLDSSSGSGASIINFSQRCYSWNKDSNYRLDADEFENLCKRAADAYKENNTAAAEELYQSALSLYKGDYLPEYTYCEWTIPTRNYYRRIYLDAVISLVQIWKKTEKFQKVIGLCEKAFTIEPYEEELHQHFIEALIEEGKTKQAQSHYEYITSLLYKEMAVKPSAELRNLYRRIKNDPEIIPMDLGMIQETMQDKQNKEGAFYCEPEIFQSLYKLEARRAARTGRVTFVAMLTLTSGGYGLPESKILKKNMNLMLEIFIKTLRKGDVITKWTDSQLLVLLPEINSVQAEKVINRVKSKFDAARDPEDAVIRTKLQPLNSLG